MFPSPSLTPIVFDSHEEACKKLSASFPDREHVALVCIHTQFPEPLTFVKLLAVPPDALDYAIYTYHKNDATFWGYIRHDRVSAGTVYRNACTPKPSPLCGRPHASYRGHASPPALAEATLTGIREYVEHRFAMYQLGWTDSLDTEKACVTTATAVAYDNIAYYLILAALTDMTFHNRYPNLEPAVKWAELEGVITRRRLGLCRLSRSTDIVKRVLQIHPRCQLAPATEPVKPNCKPFLATPVYSLPFEYAGWAVAKKRAVLVRGTAFISRSMVDGVVLQHLLGIHARNADVIRPTITAPNLVPLLAAIRARFASMLTPDLVVLRPKMSFDALRAASPPCVQSMLEAAFGWPGDRLKYPVRVQLARFMLHFGWDAASVVKRWTPVLKRLYQGKVPLDIKSSVMVTEKSAKRRIAAGEVVGASCYDLGACGLCPYKKARVEDSRAACTLALGRKWPEGVPTPRDPVLSPQQYVGLALRGGVKGYGELVSLF